MLSKNGEVKVVDFGLAKANSQVEITDQGVVKGKFSYLVARGRAAASRSTRAPTCSRSASSCGRCSPGAGCSSATPHETVELVRAARIPSIIALNPNVDPELEAIVRKALARDRDERYQSAADLGDALVALPVLARS